MAENFSVKKRFDLLREYDIYRQSAPDDNDVYVKGIPYMFMTTPKLNLSKSNIERDSFLIYLQKIEPDLMKTLTTNGDTISPFIKILTNAFRGLDGKDLAARTIDIGETFYGFKQTLPISIVDSISGDTMSIHYQEYKNLPIVKLHKLWVEYTEKVRRGMFEPSPDAINKRYIDYASSIYYFVLDFDGETILYWSKYTGVVPISVPYAGLVTDGKDHEIPDLSIEYIYSYKEDLDPSILMDFNKVSMLDANAMKYENETQTTGGRIPYMTPDLMPHNFTAEAVKSTNVLVLKSDPLSTSAMTPKSRYILKFLN